MAQKKLTSFFTKQYSNLASNSQNTNVPVSDEDQIVDVDSCQTGETNVELAHEVEPEDNSQEDCLEELQEESTSTPCECPCCTDEGVPHYFLNLSESSTSHSSQR